MEVQAHFNISFNGCKYVCLWKLGEVMERVALVWRFMAVLDSGESSRMSPGESGSSWQLPLNVVRLWNH